MSVIQFESVVEGNIIRIPEQYIGQIPTVVAVTIVDIERPRLNRRIRKELPDINDFPAVFDTSGWKFDREEANERR
ncbi:MAG: hypothetical protein FWF87_06850 [Synergistaceae bacterium]|nr:hypothetical protein [Synergistaceae bacterium]